MQDTEPTLLREFTHQTAATSLAIQTTLQKEAKLREKTAKELVEFSQLITERKGEIPIENLLASITLSMQQSRQNFVELNNGLKQYPDASYQLKTNKMVEVLDGGYQVVTQHLEEILNMEPSSDVTVSNPIVGYNFNYLQPEISVLGDESGFFGNSKGTFLKAAIFHSALAMYGRVSIDEFNSSIFHTTPLPNNFRWDTLNPAPILGPYFEQGSVTIIHSGYAFGGHRGELNHPYPPGKPFGPEDCSSAVAKTIGESTGSLSTVDLLRRFRYSSEANRSLVPLKWSDSALGQELQAKLEPVNIKDPQRDLQSGMIYCHRTFPGGIQLNGEGSGGHTAQVVGFFRNKIVTLGCNRNMTKVEGYGIQEYPISDSTDRQQMFFRVKGGPGL